MLFRSKRKEKKEGKKERKKREEERRGKIKKQKVFHLRNKDSVCSFFIMYSFFLHWAWGIEASTFFGFIDFQENLKTSER